MKKIGIVVFAIVLGLALYGCSKEDNTIERILGTWTMVGNSSVKWTFIHLDDDDLYDYQRNRCSIAVDTIKTTCRFDIDHNTLLLSPYHIPYVYGNLKIDKISRKKLWLSGELEVRNSYYDEDGKYHSYSDYIDIGYKFRK